MNDGPRLPGVETVDEEDRIVLHVDADCFYASCERLKEPELEGEPVVVGMGYEAGETIGAVATASYEAREFGVESAQAISTALEKLPRRAPLEDDSNVGENSDGDADDDTGSDGEATSNDNADSSMAAELEVEDTGYYRQVDMDYYESVASEVREILHDCADVVREVSIDEAYLDVTDRTAWEVADGFARHVKGRIEREVGVTVSIGVAPTMSAAKIASDFDKPDGLTVVRPGEIESFLAPLEVELLHGVGPVTARELRSMGLETAGEVAATDPGPLEERFGERGRELYERARGDDDRRVEPRGEPKSFSRESAFAEAVEEPEPKYELIETLAAAVADRATREGALYRTVGVKAVLPPFDVNTRERSLSGPVDDPELVDRIARDLFTEFETEPVRKLGVRVANLEFTGADQASLDGWDDVAGGGSTEPADDSMNADSESAEPKNNNAADDESGLEHSSEPTAITDEWQADGETDESADALESSSEPDGLPAGQSSLSDFGSR
ncbi:DNA polymerase IV [Halostagnicola sp. A-GB9-2]|uniref:DNA polymerase Y family protein n=1 Tax=Halostagnicola sp. A-GB9-2 TaxID=3048066 RepID=UPI0024C034B8|nr:DNA polymerase IV [Halostagnicola sp. A-GB9-2]MDJ1431610.1 DNA polymerase IV [Halostagnicola sp. A-GB9-2]